MRGVVYQARRACGLLYAFLLRNPPGVWLLPANACPDVPATFETAGRRFETIDVCPQTLHLDEELVWQRVQSLEVAGLLYIDSYGSSRVAATLEFFQRLKHNRPELLIVWDRCLCYPDCAEPPGCADLVLYSTGRAKPLDLGGGAFGWSRQPLSSKPRTYEPEAHAEWEHCVKHSRSRGTPLPGGSSSCNWLDSEFSFDCEYLVRVQDKLDFALQHRRSITEVYRHNIPAEAQMPKTFHDWRFNILVRNPQELLRTLFENGLWASSHYQDVSPLFGLRPCAVARQVSEHIVNLFSDQTYSLTQAEITSHLVSRHVAASGCPDWNWAHETGKE